MPIEDRFDVPFVAALALKEKQIQPLNAGLGNASFSEKKPCYLKSEYILTKELAEFNTWGPDQVNERQERLA